MNKSKAIKRIKNKPCMLFCNYWLSRLIQIFTVSNSVKQSVIFVITRLGSRSNSLANWKLLDFGLFRVQFRQTSLYISFSWKMNHWRYSCHPLDLPGIRLSIFRTFAHLFLKLSFIKISLSRNVDKTGNCPEDFKV
jgi:hypothetical protein